MTLRTNARLAGFTYLFYIAVGLTELNVSGRATGGEGIAAKLASIAQHAPLMRISAVLSLVTAVCALVLAVTLYALTRRCDRDLALLALACRFVEGVNNATGAGATLRLLLVAMAANGAAAVDASAANALGSMLLSQHGTLISATFFAVGSTIFSYLFLRARTIPVPLAWLGVIGSGLLVVGLPLQTLQVIEPSWFLWLPAGVFEVILACWLLIKGVKESEPCQ